MQKSVWVSFCGWAFIACLSFVAGAFLVDGIYHREPLLIPPIVAGFAVWLSFPCFVLWALGSIVHRFRVGTAKMRAQALVEAQTKAGLVAPQSQTSWKARHLPAGPSSMCAMCHVRPFIVRCTIDGALLCEECIGAHNASHRSDAGAGSAAAGA